MMAAKAASIICTLQAGYTDFKYLSAESKEIFEREALIGVSITGWMNNPDVLFDKDNMKDAAELVLVTNKVVAKLIGINPAARATCAKPAGNASVLLGTASGIHGEHSPRYIRHVQMNLESEVAQLFKKTNPEMVENSVWSQNGTDVVISFPVESPAGSIYKKDLYGVKQLEYVKMAQQVWVEYGTDVSLCTHPKLRHNISNTISVDNWDEVTEYVFENKQHFAGISFLSSTGDKDYPQAPFTEVFTAEELLQEYGTASLFAGGLIVEGLKAFNENLWAACDATRGLGEDLTKIDHTNVMKKDWVRRANKFSDNYFGGDIDKMTYCLKDVYNLHKWERVIRNLKGIDWTTDLGKKEFTDIDTMGAIACAGGVCDISF